MTKLTSIPPELAFLTHKPLTRGISPSEVAKWPDGTVKGNMIDLFMRDHAAQGAVLVKCRVGSEYEIWTQKEEHNGA